MREKPTSSSRKPACMKNTRMPATSTQTVSIRPSASLSVGSMSGSSDPAGQASFARAYRICAAAFVHAARWPPGADSPTARTRAPTQSASSRGSTSKEAVGVARGGPDALVARAAPRRTRRAGRARTAARRRSRSRWPRGPPRLPAWRTSATSRASASLPVSIRWRPEATHTTGSPSATNTIDLAISDSWQPTATAASLTVRVEASRRWTRTSMPSSRAQSAPAGLSRLHGLRLGP